ncbi:anthranilate synthase component II [Halodesulfurarchaeum sp.]|uniref:anthranilate synthase component II n=1 Tax=Halodesulfurarchaeum sp. TaxID=1980530 RepID=UPI001BBEF550|nr:aminodeoxychorismate/anthranilate synthase component II [Halodesulfurarchaeum sp.]
MSDLTKESGPHILVVDNYDSFAYNLVQYAGEFAGQMTVKRNDEIDIPEIRALDPDGIIVSPGPGIPQDAGVSMPIFAEVDYPTLGVCLGHQALCAVHGSPVDLAPGVVHGKSSIVTHDGEGMYATLPDEFEAGRYHSLGVQRENLPASLEETAWTDDEPELVMGVRHDVKPHYGVQYHPESILTPKGIDIVAWFVEDVCNTT